MNNITDADKMRIYFRDFVDVYAQMAEQKSIPVDKNKLEQIIENAEFRTFENENTTGTFSVNKKLIQVIMNNFRKNGVAINNFRLFHEFTHLISPINEELFADQNALLEEFQEKASQSNNKFVTGMNAYYGLIAVDEVLAQYTAEELNDAFCKKDRQSIMCKEGPLGAKVKYKTDFSDKDIYSPLEEPVEKLIQVLGYKNLRDFSVDFLSQDKKFTEILDEQAFEKLCCIGVICKGIYKENGFVDQLNVTAEDIEECFDFLYKNISFNEAPGNHESTNNIER